MRPTTHPWVSALIVVSLCSGIHAQQQHGAFEAAGGPFSAEPMLNAPFSAVATTRIRAPLPNGTAREYTTTARYYRDSQGRVRAELDSPSGLYTVLWTVGPEGRVFYELDQDKRTYRNTGHPLAALVFNGDGTVAIPVAKACFLRAPRVAGASAMERLQAVNAEMSPELGLVIASHRSDSIVAVDYEVTDIQRVEPSSKLFDVPTDYTFVTRGSRTDFLIRLEPLNKGVCEGRDQRHP
jgi:hypothetical protein